MPLDRVTAGQAVLAADLRLRHRPSFSGESGSTGRTGRGLPSASTMTNTRYAVATTIGSATSSQRCRSSRTPTSMDVEPVQLTCAYACTRSPTRSGSRNRISSIDAVTAVPPACLAAAAPATSSTNFMITPPWTVP